VTAARILECVILHSGAKGSRRGAEPPSAAPPFGPGRIPRIARLLALAHKFEGLLNQGVADDYAGLARLGQVSRARITQIMNLLHLAPDIQEEILFLARMVRGRDPIHLRQLQPISQALDWRRQRVLWRKLTAERSPSDRNSLEDSPQSR
jgi:hypothetical protein